MSKTRSRAQRKRSRPTAALSAAASCGLVALVAPALALALELRSPSFAAQASMPAKYTCEGDDVSPPLAWSGAPSGTKSFALIVDDPDAPDPRAPKTTFVHWVAYNLPATSTELREDAPRTGMPPGSAAGRNDGQRAGYHGPCPPIGRHRYFFKLYALDVVLPDLGTLTKAQLEQAMQGHVLEKAELVGTYEKTRN